jgi:CBS domain-containing protein
MAIPNIKVDEIMTKDVIVANKDDTIQDVAKLMRAHSIKNIPVVDESKQIIGIVSSKDIVFKIVAKNINNNLPIYEIMTTDEIVFAKNENNLAEVCDIMNDRGFNVLPVINKKLELVGIISKTDLIALYPILLGKFKL